MGFLARTAVHRENENDARAGLNAADAFAIHAQSDVCCQAVVARVGLVDLRFTGKFGHRNQAVHAWHLQCPAWNDIAEYETVFKSVDSARIARSVEHRVAEDGLRREIANAGVIENFRDKFRVVANIRSRRNTQLDSS